MRNPFTAFLELLRDIFSSKVGRRYFILNSFDGILTSLGIASAAFVTGRHGIEVFRDGLIVALSLCVSGFTVAFEVEYAEAKRRIAEMEKAMLHNLKNTLVARRILKEAYINAVSNALGPLLSALAVIAPFALPIPPAIAAIASFAIGFSLAGIFGYYIGKIAGQKPIITQVRVIAIALLLFIVSRYLASY